MTKNNTTGPRNPIPCATCQIGINPIYGRGRNWPNPKRNITRRTRPAERFRQGFCHNRLLRKKWGKNMTNTTETITALEASIRYRHHPQSLNSAWVEINGTNISGYVHAVMPIGTDLKEKINRFFMTIILHNHGKFFEVGLVESETLTIKHQEFTLQ